MKNHLTPSGWVPIGRWLAGCLIASCASIAAAQTATPLFQQSFAGGLGAFTAVGPVTTSAGGAKMTAKLLTADGAITSAPISTTGYTKLSVSLDRVTAGLLITDAAIAEYALNGGTFTQLESTRTTTASRVSFALPDSAAGAKVTLRFRINGTATYESYTVNNIVLSGIPPSIGSLPKPAVGEYAAFESGPVRPMALSSDGRRLYVANTPDNRIEIFDVSGATPVPLESIPVGLEPVAVSLLNDRQLWVVNHLSDSISIIDVSVTPARVVNTLLVGDEPRDIVFAGVGNRWAFITAAHRGQNAKFDPKLTTPGIGRADVWVFNSAAPGTALGGTPVTVLNMFGDTMRALARNADGTRVYAAVFNSGNKTTVIEDNLVNGGLTKAEPATAADGTKQPGTGLIVQKNANGDWVDAGDPKTNTPPTVWNSRVKLNLPDYDVFTIDASGTTPVVANRTSGVGTTLFNMAVNPVNGKVYVSNQNSRNVIRFEGPGTRSSTVRGDFVRSRITVIDGSTVLARHLNKHITSYDQDVGTASEKAASLATPLEMAISPNGDSLYLAAMGSNKLARFSTAQLEDGSFTPSASTHVTLTGGAPTGVVLDAARNRAFVTTRYDNGLSVVSTASTLSETAHVKMFNPEPAEVVAGRKFLYDASYTSSRGDSSCAGCHIFGDMDQLSWDLGNPDEVQVKGTNTYNSAVFSFLRRLNVHPMKGPMSTQSLRGMKGNGPLHWRGDRKGVSTGATLEERAFKDFNVAFTGLLGREAMLTDAEMTSFARFALKLVYPPNPIANLDNSLTPVQVTAMNIYNTVNADTLTTCNGCHRLDVTKGQFGTDGTMSFEGSGVAEDMKIPHLRNMYVKVGMFGRNNQEDTSVGDQIRGFGFDNAGASPTISHFLSAPVFTVDATQRAQLEQLVLAFPSDLNPVVGQQVTVTPTNAEQADVKSRLNLLMQRALVTAPRPECELVVKGVMASRTRGWVMVANQSFISDKTGETPVTLPTLLAQAKTAATPLTFTCVPPGNGTRAGVDRDTNGVLDRD